MTANGASGPGRVERRRRRNHEALIAAGRAVMAEKGIDAATMQEIADRADVSAGSLYSYYRSKEDLAVAVLESLMHDLALRIEQVTDTFEDSAQVYAYGVRTVLDTATGDFRWKQLLNRPEVVADAMHRMMGPFAMRDLMNATEAGRFQVVDAEVTFRMAAYAIIGAALAVTRQEVAESAIEEATVGVLCMTGITREEAIDLARRDRPRLPELP